MTKQLPCNASNVRELLPSIQKSLGPIFDYFLAALEKQDGQVLDLQIIVKDGDIILEYRVLPVEKS